MLIANSLRCLFVPRDAAWLRVRCLDEHATAGDIANELDVSVSAVRAALRLDGVRRGR